MAKLIFIDRDFVGQVYELVMEKTTVGRSDDNTLVLRHETVSSHHCEILANDPEVIVRDLGSRNGTFVNGIRFSGQRQVKSGQTIRFGYVEARLELTHRSAADSETDETAVRLHQHAMREAAAPPKPALPPQPAPNLAISSSPPPGPDEPTILCPKTSSKMPMQAPVFETTPVQATPGKRFPMVAMAVGGIIVLVALVWWLLTSL